MPRHLRREFSEPGSCATSFVRIDRSGQIEFKQETSCTLIDSAEATIYALVIGAQIRIVLNG